MERVWPTGMTLDGMVEGLPEGLLPEHTHPAGAEAHVSGGEEEVHGCGRRVLDAEQVGSDPGLFPLVGFGIRADDYVNRGLLDEVLWGDVPDAGCGLPDLLAVLGSPNHDEPPGLCVPR